MIWHALWRHWLSRNSTSPFARMGHGSISFTKRRAHQKLSLTSIYLSRHGAHKFTPKALANFSPALERSDNPGSANQKLHKNAESVRAGPNPFRVNQMFMG